MKDYLKENLSEEERLIIIGIIWKVSRKFKMTFYQNKKRYFKFVDEYDSPIEDVYNFYEYDVDKNNVEVCPLTEKQKCDIVMTMDALLREASLFNLIRTLTFNEKLVFFLHNIENYRNNEVSIMLEITEQTAINRRKSIDKKIKTMKGEIENE